jgi:hypothetical protein
VYFILIYIYMASRADLARAHQRILNRTIEEYGRKTNYQRTLGMFNHIRDRNISIIHALDGAFPDILNGRAYEGMIAPNPNFGITPLMFAVEHNRRTDERVIDTLLASQNIDMFIKDKSGKNVLFNMLAAGIEGKYIKKVLDREPCLFLSTYLSPIATGLQSGGNQRGGNPREWKPFMYINNLIERMNARPTSTIAKAKQALIEWMHENEAKWQACPTRPATPRSRTSSRSRTASRSSPRSRRASRSSPRSRRASRSSPRSRRASRSSPRRMGGLLWGRERMSRTPSLNGGGTRRTKRGGGCGCNN